MMDVKLPITLHNRFDIEVKDIRTGEITKKGMAENIILDQHWSKLLDASFGANIKYINVGEGTGVLSPSRTSLFAHLARYSTILVEKIFNTPPLPSIRTIKAIIPPEALVGKIIREVGLAHNTAITDLATHALIKDSEGNPLEIGPKTNTEEITIYATVYATIEGYDNIQFPRPSGKNKIFDYLLGEITPSDFYNTGQTVLYLSSDGSPTNLNANYEKPAGVIQEYFASGFNSRNISTRTTAISKRISTVEGNGKIKSIIMRYFYSAALYQGLFRVVFPNAWFPGYQLLNKAIGVGDGAKVTFILPWDEANLTKGYKVYVDGVEQTTGVAFAAASVTFDAAPQSQAKITGNWWVDYIPKDTDHVLDIFIGFTLAEGVV